MLDTHNYFDRTAAIDWPAMPTALAKGHSLVQGASQENWKAYRDNENIRRVVSAYFEKLDSYLAAQKPAVKPAQKPAPKAGSAKAKSARTRTASPKKQKAAPAPKAAAKAKAKPVPPKDSATPVELIGTDVQFIRRYVAMHGKVKSQAQVLSLLHALQKAILERRIRKESPYAKEIGQVQDQLILLYEKMGDMAEVLIEAERLKKYRQIATSQANMPSINLLKAYVRLNGKKGVQDKAQKLVAQMRKAVHTARITKEDPYAAKLNQAFTTLVEYAATGSEAALHIHKTELNGLMGILAGAAGGKKKARTRPLPKKVGLW